HRVSSLFPYPTLFRSQTYVGGAQDGINAGSSRVDARVAFDAFGNAYITYLAAASASDVRLVVGRSSNGGASWSFVSAVSNTFPEDRKSTRLNSSHESI